MGTFKVSVKRQKTGNLNRFLRELSHRVETALVKTGEHLLEMSNNLAPRDTESLVESSHARKEGSGFYTVVIVGYGSYGDRYVEFSPREGRVVQRHPHDYAVLVHEGLGPYPTAPEHQHFLSIPLYMGLNDLALVFRTYVQM
jgi:hypothetical protein